MSSKVYSIVLDKILDAMESGVVPWQSPYLFEGHRNVTGREYRGVNVLLLNVESMAYGYELPVWLTFKQAKERGWSIKKGERGHVVVFFKQIEVKRKAKVEVDEDGMETEVETGMGIEAEAGAGTGKETVTVPCLRYYKVFNVQQLAEYEEIKQKYLTQMEVQNDDVLDRYIENSGVIFEHKSWGVSCYIPRLDKIEMAAVRTEYLQTLAHEVIHSTGHPKRLGRFNLDDIVDDGKYSQEELVAEIGSSFLLARIGETPSYQNSASYIAGWARYLKENKKTAIFRAASQAQKACEYVLKVAGAAEEVKKAA